MPDKITGGRGRIGCLIPAFGVYDRLLTLTLSRPAFCGRGLDPSFAIPGACFQVGSFISEPLPPAWDSNPL